MAVKEEEEAEEAEEWAEEEPSEVGENGGPAASCDDLRASPDKLASLLGTREFPLEEETLIFRSPFFAVGAEVNF